MALDWNGLSNAMEHEANGLTGNIEKAVLVFPDPVRSINLEDPDAVGAFGSSLGMGTVATRVTAANMKNAKAKISQVSQASATVSTIMQKADGKLSEFGGKTFRVPFNPSSLQVTARGGGRSLVSNYGAQADKTAISYRSLDPYITVSFSVMFDELNPADAFMEERLTAGASTLARNALTAAMGKEYSVREQAEGFMAAIRNADHRMMIFQWGSLRYMGALNSLSGRYTMFNTAGNPIRAEVQLGMLIGGAAKDSFDGASYLDYWKKRYSDILNKNAEKNKEGELASMAAGGLKNQYTNLINL